MLNKQKCFEKKWKFLFGHGQVRDQHGLQVQPVLQKVVSQLFGIKTTSHGKSKVGGIVGKSDQKKFISKVRFEIQRGSE